MIIVLTGFMGTGKSTVGRFLASRLGCPHVDTDALVEQRAGRSVKEIFASDGEAAFRALEKEAVMSAVAGQADAVISTGGGALVNSETRAFVKARAVVVTLTASIDVIMKRVGSGDERPLLSGPGAKDNIQMLLKERAASYADAHLVIDTTNCAIEQVAADIIAFVKDNPSRNG